MSQTTGLMLDNFVHNRNMKDKAKKRIAITKKNEAHKKERTEMINRDRRDYYRRGQNRRWNGGELWKMSMLIMANIR